jgi:hypothetical protein
MHERKKCAGPGRGHIVTLQGEIDCERMPLDWPLKLLQLYEQGCCDTEVKAQISKWRGLYSAELFDAWMEREEFFCEIIQLGRLYAEAWWRGRGRGSIDNANFNLAAYQMQMFNRYGWLNAAAKNQHTIDAGPTLAAILKDLAESNRGFPVRAESSRGDQGPAE